MYGFDERLGKGGIAPFLARQIARSSGVEMILSAVALDCLCIAGHAKAFGYCFSCFHFGHIGAILLCFYSYNNAEPPSLEANISLGGYIELIICLQGINELLDNFPCKRSMLAFSSS